MLWRTWKHENTELKWPLSFEHEVECFYGQALGWQLHIADICTCTNHHSHRRGLLSRLLRGGGRALAIAAMASLSVADHLHAKGESHWVRNEGAPNVLVFVHGFTGDGGSAAAADSTWTNPDAPNAYWPSLVEKDQEYFKGVDVFVFDYESSLTLSKNLGPPELADHLYARLKTGKDAAFKERRQFMFVAHSLGGLVVREALLSYDDLSGRTAFIYLFSVPTAGSWLADIGHWLGFNSNPIVEYLHTNSGYIENLSRRWERRAMAGTVRTFCAYEGEEGALVKRWSARMKCDTTTGIAGDHASIVKPYDIDDEPHYLLRNAFAEEIGRRPDLTGTSVFLIYCGAESEAVAQALKRELRSVGAVLGYDKQRCDWGGGGYGFNVVHYRRPESRSTASALAEFAKGFKFADQVQHYDGKDVNDLLIGLCPNSSGTVEQPTKDKLECKP